MNLFQSMGSARKQDLFSFLSFAINQSRQLRLYYKRRAIVPEQTLFIKFDEYGSHNYYLARLVDGDSPKAFPYSIANFPVCAKP